VAEVAEVTVDGQHDPIDPIDPIDPDGASDAAATSGKRVDRTKETRRRVLEVVTEQLEDGGEGAVRVGDVRNRSGVSIGSIYHHFGDRDGMISAAQVHRFARYAEAEIGALSEIVQRSADIHAFRSAVRQLTLHTASSLRASQRWGRIGVLGSTIGREDLAAEVRAVQTRLTDEFQAHVAQGQARGFFRSDLDARAIAAFIEAYSLGLALNDLDEYQVDEQAWEQVVWAALDALFVS
jgi:AcrR family transcriptional regulator